MPQCRDLPCACTFSLTSVSPVPVYCVRARSRAEGEARVTASVDSVTMATAATATATATTATATARPTKSGPKHKRVRKRTAECQAKRDARRREAWKRKKEGDTLKILHVGDDAGPSPSGNLGVENANTQVQAHIQAQGRHEVEGAIGTASRKVGGGFVGLIEIQQPRVVPYNTGWVVYRSVRNESASRER